MQPERTASLPDTTTRLTIGTERERYSGVTDRHAHGGRAVVGIFDLNPRIDGSSFHITQLLGDGTGYVSTFDARPQTLNTPHSKRHRNAPSPHDPLFFKSCYQLYLRGPLADDHSPPLISGKENEDDDGSIDYLHTHTSIPNAMGDGS